MISSAANQGIDILEIWLRYFLLVLTLPFWILAFVLVATGLITAMFNSLRMLGHIKPNTGALDWKLGFNAFNAIYLPQYLTEQGLTVRKKIFRGVIVFLAGFMIVLPMKLVTEYIFSY